MVDFFVTKTNMRRLVSQYARLPRPKDTRFRRYKNGTYTLTWAGGAAELENGDTPYLKVESRNRYVMVPIGAERAQKEGLTWESV